MAVGASALVLILALAVPYLNNTTEEHALSTKPKTDNVEGAAAIFTKMIVLMLAMLAVVIRIVIPFTMVQPYRFPGSGGGRILMVH